MNIEAVHTVGNIGAGTMGHATALQFALKGYKVHLLDMVQAGLDRGMSLIEHDLKTFADNGMLTEPVETVLGRISTYTDYESALTGVDFVIELAAEDLQIKQSIWQQAEQFVGPGVVLATNTSGLSPTAIQEGLKHPERFVVAHFWNPAHLMPLVEVVPGKQTSEATVDFTVDLLNHIGKHAVPLKVEALGFVGNRIQLAVIRECMHIIGEGIASPEAVDDVVKYSLGRRWSLVGPVASADLGGLDIFEKLTTYLYQDLANGTGEDPFLKQKVDANELGLKTGRGFFDWEGDAGKQIVADRDKALLELLKKDQEQ
ncbi:3-hydroxyacyl-CoA dehydrogenase family protein [Limosilactobacillus fermentum]|uniref:3-hydroxyacyl-CoA dehydrogenase family protein n=1 Tax=Limosilactobacillus fermentum TaxID=1613 RepID=UPI000CE2954A|nr:3-hydroxyacyl-CoA dehydrogenase family protein [Limosilactobacillus fermentum]SNX31320.1 putative 3-hydroxybutyryl-CoA dehydrogenase [Limosilactobacillus fermentum]